ncbi:hypothetical protein LCGC14_0673610 [marine sediment metagenome]|uniref:Uncharacterized protein n=1 Tax=marine sediment metagenome TaxID=412755 RepID=A0A0F9QQD8_9ZZZZ
MKRLILVTVLCALCASAVCAQEPVEPAASVTPPELTELEQLTLKNLLQGFTIAQLQRQAAQRNEDVARGAFWRELNRLRAEKNAPEAEFTFNPQTMSFTPKPESPGDAEKPKEE